LDLFEDQLTLDAIEKISKSHQRFIDEYGNNPVFRSAKSIGTILSLEVEVGEGSSYFSDMRLQAYQFFLENELLIRPLGNVIFINPPYCITPQELEYVYLKVLEFVTDFSRVRNL
jgi:adenosylmethionine-8-amino-7-oxononanoate aminotransferase